MSRKGYTPEQIIQKLRQAEVELAKGATVGVVCQKIGVSEQTYYRWRTEYGGDAGGPGEAPEGAGAGE